MKRWGPHLGRAREPGVDLPQDVLEALLSEPGLIAVADAIRATRPAPGYRSRVAASAALVAAVIAAAALALVMPWQARGTDVIQRAAAAAGQTRLLTLTVSTKHPLKVGVDAESGRVIRSAVEIAATYDQRTMKARAVAVTPDEQATTTPEVEAMRAAVGEFAADYRSALEAREAKVVGRTKTTIWVRLALPNGATYEVALDSKTYEPVLLRVVPKGSSAAVTLDVVHFAPKN